MKKLYRSKTNRTLLGVCGGLGEYLGIDPTIVRVIYLILVFFYGSGIILYYNSGPIDSRRALKWVALISFCLFSSLILY